MLFNSYEFLFFFLPLTVGMFFLLCARRWVRAAATWIAVMSVLFYGYWSPRYVILLMASVVTNFLLAQVLLRCRAGANSLNPRHVLTFAVAANLVTLGYFKYANFFVD